MYKYFSGLTTVNIELTNKCNKNCWMCGRRKIEKEYPEITINYGNMEFDLLRSISGQLPEGIIVQFHNNGEPLLYPRFGDAVKLFKNQIKCTDTNGKLIIQKADQIIGILDTLTISVFENDDESEKQYDLIKEFLKIKGTKKPNLIIRCLGKIDLIKYEKLGCIIATRILHSPMGSFKYKKKPTVPETGICLDLLSHMVIKKDGKVSVCVRFDPYSKGIVGDCLKTPLLEIWNGKKRKKYLEYHITGKRNKIEFCRKCEFWGVPTGY